MPSSYPAGDPGLCLGKRVWLPAGCPAEEAGVLLIRSGCVID